MMPPQTEGGQGRILVRIDPDLEAIVPGFLANRQRDLTTIDACLKQGDLRTISLLGHRMKGDGGGYGFEEISTIGDHMEQAALAQDLAALSAHVEHLRNFLSRVEIVYSR